MSREKVCLFQQARWRRMSSLSAQHSRRISFIHGYRVIPVDRVVFSFFLIGCVSGMNVSDRGSIEENGSAGVAVLPLPYMRALPNSFGDVVIGVSMAMANLTLFIVRVAVLRFISVYDLLLYDVRRIIVFPALVDVGNLLCLISIIVSRRSRRHSISET
jgi:hypothetical protein